MEDNKYVGVIVEREFLSDEKILYILDYATVGVPMVDGNGNKFFRTDKDDYYYINDFNSCLNENKYYCAFYNTFENLKEEVKKIWNIDVSNTDDLIDVISDVMFDTVFVSNVDYGNEEVNIIRGTLPRREHEDKEIKMNLQEKYDEVKTKESFLPVKVDEKVKKDYDIKSILDLNLKDIDSCSYEELKEIKEKMEKEYHDRNILNAYIKYKQGNSKLLSYFEEEFVNSSKVKDMITALKNKVISTDDLDEYKDANGNLLEKINDYMKEIDYKINYTDNKEEIEKEEEQLEFVFTTLQNIKDSNKIYDEMRKVIISQDDAIRRLITEINKFSLLDDPSNKKGILLTGSTGVGKTLIIKTLAKHLNKPVCIIDSSQLVINGYRGTHIDEYLAGCLASLNYDVKALENAIIYFDEIDKKGMRNDSEVSGKGVLDSLLKFLDGTVYNLEVNDGMGMKTYQVKTDNMLVVAGGSFSTVYDREPERGMGFLADINPKLEIKDEDFMKYANMTNEFMGRFPIVIHLNKLEEKDYKRILLESEISPLKIEKEMFEKVGVHLTTTQQFLNEVSKQAAESSRGARGLTGIMANCTSEAFSYVSNHLNEVDTIKLNKKTIEDNKKFTIVKVKK